MPLNTGFYAAYYGKLLEATTEETMTINFKDLSFDTICEVVREAMSANLYDEEYEGRDIIDWNSFDDDETNEAKMSFIFEYNEDDDFDRLDDVEFSVSYLTRLYELIHPSEPKEIDYIELAKIQLRIRHSWDYAKLADFVAVDNTLRMAVQFNNLNDGREAFSWPYEMIMDWARANVPESEWYKKKVLPDPDDKLYKRVETKEPEKVFNNAEYKIKDNMQYLLTKNITNNFESLFDGIKSSSTTTALSYINSIVNNVNFDETIKKVYHQANEDIEKYILDNLRENFAPFCKSDRTLYIRDWRSSNPSLDGMVNSFLRRSVVSLITSFKFVLCTKDAIIVQVTTSDRAGFRYWQFFLSGQSLDNTEWDSLPKMAGVTYKPDLARHYGSEYSAEYQHEVPVDKRELLSSVSWSSPRYTSIVHNTACHDWPNSGIAVKALPEHIQKHYKLKSAKPYLLSEERIAEKKEFPDVVIGAKNCDLSFKSKRGINDLLAIILRSYPLVYTEGLQHLAASAPILNKDGTFDKDDVETYRLEYACSGKTLYVEANNGRDSILFAFFFQDMELELDTEQFNTMLEIVKDDYNKINLDKLTEFKTLSSTIQNSAAKIARMMYADRIEKSRSMYVDDSLRSFFDGVKSSLTARMSKPQLPDGKFVDARTAPTLHASIVAKDSQLMNVIDKITKQNYYKGGVCVKIK